MKILYLECNMGVAGDMLMAALYELLSPAGQSSFLATMNQLFPGVEVRPRQAVTCGITGTHMDVTVRGEPEHSHDVALSHHQDAVHAPVHEMSHDEAHHGHEHGHAHSHHHTTMADVTAIVDALALPLEVRAAASAVYGRIAQAESKAHGVPVEQVHFHEVGALDAVTDVTGVCLAIHMLRPDRISASPIHLGSGQVCCAHGVMPVPAPATARLLEGVPCYTGDIRGELCTPTGAALVSQFAGAFGPMPVMTLEKTGYGVGAKEFPAANCVRAFLGETAGGDGSGEIVELVCNLDDMTPEALAFACARILELGALDVYTLPGQMKKGRPGWVLTALCEPDRESQVAAAILKHTATNGLRARRCVKYFLAPRTERAETRWGSVRVKRAEGLGIVHAKPEYDDVAAVAREHGLSFEAVWKEVLSQL